ncbi:MAG TPA: Era-like GTP-binding protein [Candidatus Thermoplasmatota archaeon]|nr:Era-like GTP-binding protein [Candidatus Thermoplasmatota archaeon]
MALGSFFKSFRNKLKGLFRGKSGKGVIIGIYGAPNAGKSLLSNTICADWKKETLGSVSEVPHETRNVQVRQEVVLTSETGTMTLDIMDTPGLVSQVSALDLEMFYNMDPEEAKRRAKEATEGILEAIRQLEKITGMLLVIDSTRDPLQQVNQTLLAHVRGRNLPVIIVANKTDLPTSNVKRVEEAFGKHYPVVAISALKHDNFEKLYEEMFSRFN